MLELRRIVKDYRTGDTSVRALNGISLRFRRNEFVSILGPSGCGKTTLLNIIGGLDQYTSGDLVIGGVSTKKYNDADWDAYRNHSIGFVFQSYNLIPHQTVLANVELALTLSGISPSVRRARAIRALRDVGLGSQINKKPSQLSGGQMQRVAIARALVNEPDIILADEPTGALDTATSVQIMEILKKISRRKLIIMVTHNPELAKEYSSRIISMVDGRVTNDTNPCWGGGFDEARGSSDIKKKKRRNPFSINTDDVERFHMSGTGLRSARGKRKKSMSFFTALSLSLNNLMTKKARTFMVSFAGSIGIIGIALILSVSTGVNNYINAVQRETLASYPIQLMAESTDLSSLITSMMEATEEKELDHELDKVYESTIMADLMTSLQKTQVNKNDLKAFKQFLESEKGDSFREYLSAVQYQYNFNWTVLTKDRNEKVIKSDAMELFKNLPGFTTDSSATDSMMDGMGSTMMGSFNVWQEMLPALDADEDAVSINSLITSEYDVIRGEWPDQYNEIVLVVNKRNEVSDLALYALGLKTQSDIFASLMPKDPDETSEDSDEEPQGWDYDEFIGMEFFVVLPYECYAQDPLNPGTYEDVSKRPNGLSDLYAIVKDHSEKDMSDIDRTGMKLKISGIIRPKENSSASILSGTIAYTSKLTEVALQKNAEKNELLKKQTANEDAKKLDVFTGKPFQTKEPTLEEMKAAVNKYFAENEEELNSVFIDRFCTPSEEEIEQAYNSLVSNPQQLAAMVTMALKQQGKTDAEIQEALAMLNNLPPEQLRTFLYADFKAGYIEQTGTAKRQYIESLKVENPTLFEQMRDTAMSEENISDDDYIAFYDKYCNTEFSKSTLEKNLALLGNVSLDSPSTINLFCNTFEDKDMIADLINGYNDDVEEAQEIKYTDYVALLVSSVTTIVDAITYVLIAFVAISLVVSSIMIGIITYISVLERTKEIGILRAIGASKKDIRRVFNAETLIVGFVAGALGIGITLGLNVVINIILFKLTGLANLKAVLPPVAALVLVGISMALTLIAGIFPSGFAAKRNPVEALRTE